MKKHLLLFLVVLTLFITPLCANTSKNIYLNNLLYEPIHKVLLIEQMTYISLDDLLELTYGSSTQKEDALEINLNGMCLKTALNSRVIQTMNSSFTLTKPIQTIDSVIYVPVELFKHIDYPCTITDTDLSFLTPVAYSTSTDRYIDHTHISAGQTKLTDLVRAAYTTPEEGETLLKEAIKNNYYLVLPFKSEDARLTSAFKAKLKTALPMEIVVRQGDFLSKTPCLSTLKTIPITPTLQQDKLTVQIENTTLSPTYFEVAFNPSDDENMIDSDKTFDAILMRLIYAYYRDYYHLKDDVHFSPVSIIEMKRSDTMHFKVYLDQVMDAPSVTYDMVISKRLHPDRISYIVDFIKLY